MKPTYDDLIQLASGKPPKWFDMHGTPRWAPLHPDNCTNIYTDRMGFFMIQCQGCGQMFIVEMYEEYNQKTDPRGWHYGDPPNYCCAVGATMNSIPRAIVAFWERSPDMLGWARHIHRFPLEVDWTDSLDETEILHHIDMLVNEKDDTDEIPL